MAYVKRISNAKNTTTMSHTQAAQYFQFAPRMPFDPHVPQTVLTETIRALQTTKQNLITPANPLSSDVIVFDSGESLAEQLATLTTTANNMAETLHDIEGGGVSTIGIVDGVTVIDGPTSVSEIRFGDQTQTVAFTNEWAASLDTYFVQLPAIYSDISSIQQAHIDLSNTQFDITASLEQNTQVLTDISTIAYNLGLVVEDICNNSLIWSSTAIELTEQYQDLSSAIATVQEFQGRLDISVNLLSEIQTTQDASYALLNEYIQDVSDYLYPIIDEHTTNLDWIRTWITTASVSFDELSSAMTSQNAAISDLSALVSALDNSLNTVGLSLDALTTDYTTLAINLVPILDWNATLTDISNAVQTIQTNTQYISQFTDSQRQNTVFDGTVVTTLTSNDPLDLSHPNMSIVTLADNADYYVNWYAGVQAVGIAKEFDLVVQTNCDAMTFMSNATETGLRLSLVSDVSSVFYGTGVVVNGGIQCTSLTAETLTCAQITTDAWNHTVQNVSHSSNVFTLDYTNGLHYTAVTQPSANFSVALVNCPADKGFTFSLRYTANFTVDSISAKTSSNVHLLTTTPPTMYFLDGTNNVTGTVKICEIQVVPSVNRALVHIKNFS